MKNVFNRFAAEPTFGIKLTNFKIPFFINVSEKDLTDEAMRYLRDKLPRKFKDKHPWLKKAYIDNGDLEIPSTIYTSKAKFLKDYDKLLDFLQCQFYVVPSSLIDMETEGGCHLNFSFPKTKDGDFVKRFCINLQNFIYKNPAMVWGFLAPTDNQSSKMNMKSFGDPRDLRKTEYMTFRDRQDHCIHSSVYDYTLSDRIRTDHNWTTIERIELRFFMMPKTTRELDIHIRFAQQLLNYVYHITQQGGVIECNPFKEKAKKRYTAEYAVQQLIEVCRTINFNAGLLVAVGKFKNLRERFEYNDRYLV